MEGAIALALTVCANRFRQISINCVLSESEEGGCYVLCDGEGRDFLLKLAFGTRRSMLAGEWEALSTLARLAPQCAPAPIMRGEEEGFTWLLREYIAGQTLCEWVDSRGQIPAREAMGAANALIRLIKDIHAAGLICRDIKPENLVRTPEGRWALIDAGTVRTPAPEKGGDTVLYVTKGFAAPEQYGFAQSDMRTDVYALGVTLCCLFTGGMDMGALNRKNVPRRARKVITRCMAFSPEARYAGMDEVYRALNSRRGRIAAAVLAAVAAICVIAACVYGALCPRVPTADSYDSLTHIIMNTPEGSDATIRITGDIQAEQTIPIWHSRITFVGDGTITAANPDRAAVRVYPGSELVLTDGITIQSTLKPECVAVQGGRLDMRGGTLIKLADVGTLEGYVPPMFVLLGGEVEISGGNIIDRRTSGGSIGVQLGEDSRVVMRGGRIDAMGDGCQGVLIGRNSVFEMSGGMISGISREKVGYTINDNALGSVEYTGGELLVNGLASVPLEFSYTTVRTYDELIKAIAAKSTAGRLVVEGTIVVPQYISLNDGRDVSIMGADKDARLTGGEGGLFLIGDGCSMTLTGLTLDADAHIENLGGAVTLENVALTASREFITNHGGQVTFKYGVTAHIENGYLLYNAGGGTADISVDAVVNGGSAIINEGELRLHDSVVDLKGAEAAWIENREGATFAHENVAYLRNGETVENEP